MTTPTVERLVAVESKVDALTIMVKALLYPWWYRLCLILAENENGQLKFVTLLVLGLAAVLNGAAMAGWGFSISAAAADLVDTGSP